jgi:proteic killer suppression protein
MIRSFRHRGLELFFRKSDARKIPADKSARIERMLDRLEASSHPEDMNIPGWRWHPLKGKRKGEYAVAVSGNWRVTFKFDGEHAIEVNLEDYH